MNTPSVNPADLSRPDCLDDEMIAEQWRLEEDMTQRGFEAYHRNLNAARIGGAEDATAYGAALMLHRVQAVSDGIKAFMEAANSGKAGKKHTAVRPLRDIGPDVAAFLALRAVLPA
ncbi:MULTISPECIES: hypothetical protein [unclassified Variovorax]|uniref:hypothetical protein n=1 Tax=unclassified Variovorax TaxID=663243 RepID=UPI003F4470E6